MRRRKNKVIPVDSDYEFILIASMRYVIGRRSYAPSLVANYIKKHWNDISDNCKFVLQRDLQYEIDQANRYIATQELKNNSSGCGGDSDDENCSFQEKRYTIPKYDPLGSKYDREMWIDMNKWMKENTKI